MAKVFNFENIDYDMKNFPKPQNLLIDWGRNGDKSASSMHSVSSYLAMFSPSFPKFFIENFSKPGDLVYDPFSGRGTTALKARELGRNFVGSDLNPYALVLSRAKIARVDKNEAILFIREMERKYLECLKNNFPFFTNEEELSQIKYFYSDHVLKQLIFLRENYGKNWRKFNNVQNLVFSIALGLMHGQMRKDGSTNYFSLDMPNAISFSPNYVKKYSEAKRLYKPEVNVFDLLIKRLNSKYDDIFSQEFSGKIFEINALEENKGILDNTVDLLITSPPYLSVVDYTKSNWIKLWLLGYDRDNLKKEIHLSDGLSFSKYVSFITKFLNNVYPKIAQGGHVVLIVGDVHKKRLIEEVWDLIGNQVSFKLIKIYWDEKYLQQNKSTNMLNSRKGQATTIEKVLLLRK